AGTVNLDWAMALLAPELYEAADGYERLAEMFAVEEGENIWKGKAIIFVFNRREDFEAMERKIMDHDPGGAAGLCHSYGDGKVIITFYRQPDKWGFATILVHETVHGFIHRYRSPIHVPSWLNEGLAEMISEILVPKSRWVPNKERAARRMLRDKKHIPMAFFQARNIDFDYYGVASSMTKFMVEQSRDRYVDMINGIKDGVPWRQAVEKRYGVELERLVAAWSSWFKVPGVTVR
ncbi:MAG: hypothetical protein R3336_07715, partial [Phycisphaeraceae bacterium]|nr:hypothetical protein [Phycisphaeraceae bacterium]